MATEGVGKGEFSGSIRRMETLIVTPAVRLAWAVGWDHLFVLSLFSCLLHLLGSPPLHMLML